jgi:predicted dehydrogenase
MQDIRLGIIGLGIMGHTHATAVASGKVRGLVLTAVCDSDAARRALWPQAAGFATVPELLASGTVDAVLIATPHYCHPDQGIAALEAGLHVLVEKPVAVHTADAARLIAAHRGRERQVLAAMFNQRTAACYQRLRELVRSGGLGELRRLSWTVTNWFRTAAYYRAGGWRATWAGEGGGVLLNQCPHNLDLLQWIAGQPSRVHAHCHFGKHHAIEVEDEVTAYLEFPNGATGVFITSTGEAPGTNRLEIAGELGRVVCENEQLTFLRNAMPMTEFSRTATDGFAAPPVEPVTLDLLPPGGQHVEILQNFADAILTGAPLIAPAEEGIHSVELANAMLLSTWQGCAIDLPLDGALYARHLAAKVAASPRNR